MIHESCNLPVGIGAYQQGWCYTCWLELNPELWRKAATRETRPIRGIKKKTITAPVSTKPASKKCCGGGTNADYAVRLDDSVGSR